MMRRSQCQPGPGSYSSLKQSKPCMVKIEVPATGPEGAYEVVGCSKVIQPAYLPAKV